MIRKICTRVVLKHLYADTRPCTLLLRCSSSLLCILKSESGSRGSSTLKRTITWSLEVSSQNAVPQAETDVFLVPTDMLYFIPTYDVQQDPTNPCQCVRLEKTTFVSEAALQPKETTYGVSFLTRQYVRDSVIPEIQEKMADPEALADVKAQLEASLATWQDVLDRIPLDTR